ncbi:Gfo/Idh/MocA family protein [Conexibacter woesei]|uniref:Gfo/Idh/MocA family protein n=1 Tax=Conexibacter woesei TaxID=191495 RepID=UPI000427ACC6|nr:Gfo/Idh/MocA family oxidoreductase [Conexibacter woesei]
MSSLNWGLLSTARINDALLHAGVNAVAVGSRDEAKARAYADARGIAKAYGSYEALLADPDIDIIYNSLPNSMHLPWAVRALEAGKHVLCEKPLSRRAADVEAAFDVAQRAGRVLTEGFMWRHHPQVQRVQELVAEGAIGTLRVIRSDFAFNLLDMTDVRMQRAMDGGALMDVGSYCVSASRTFAGGEPVAASAQRIAGGDGVDLALTGLLRFDGDVLAVFDCAFTGPARHFVQLLGSEGSLRLADPWHARGDQVIEHRGLDPDAAPERIVVPAVNHYALQIADLEAAARGEKEPRLGRADAVGQARALELLYASAEA